MHFSFPATIHSWNSLVIWLGMFNFELILKVLKYKHVRGVRMLMCRASFSSSLTAPYHWRFLNKFCYVNICKWSYFSIWLKAAYTFCKQNNGAEACCSHRSCSWKTLCLCTYIDRGKGCWFRYLSCLGPTSPLWPLASEADPFGAVKQALNC